MGNLGAYQLVTTWSKKVGGPFNLLGIVAVGGYVVFRGMEAGGKQIYKLLKNRNGKTEEITVEDAPEFVAKKDGVSNEGLRFVAGDRFRVLQRDKEAVLIDKVGDSSSPYFVSADFLSSISDYK